MTDRHERASRHRDNGADRLRPSVSTPTAVVARDRTRPSDEPDDQAEAQQWELMLTRLATERARQLVADAISTLEELAPARAAPTDTALRDLHRAVRRLGVS
jgi:hypothetical protein